VDIDDILALNETVFVFVLSTWVGGAPPEACRPFFDWLLERKQSQDNVLATWKFAVFGVGNSIYGERVYNAVRRVEAVLVD
jgi:sulfite reductase alpha subunit-like flavoprotein